MSADRVDLLASALATGSIEVPGSPPVVCRTNRDLYQRLVGVGRRMNADRRTLSEFLRGWWQVGRLLAGRASLDLDTAAATVVAAATVDPPPVDPRWRTAVLSGRKGFGLWEAVVLSQIADLADFADQGPLDEMAYFGIDAPRPDGVRRATWIRWYNFDPLGYLECGMAGSLGGWDEDDGIRASVDGPVVPLKGDPEPGIVAIATLDWTQLANVAGCGQTYE